MTFKQKYLYIVRLFWDQRLFIIFYIALLLLIALLCALYALPMQLCWDLTRLTWLPVIVLVLYRVYQEHQQIKQCQSYLSGVSPDIYHANNFVENSYLDVIRQFKEKSDTTKNDAYQSIREHQDYLMTWSHAIKTPLTALKIQADSQMLLSNHAVRQQVLLIERQLELLLNYERLSDFNHDLEFGWFDLKRIVNDVVQRYATFFIAKNISVNVKIASVQILTDEKWLTFVLDQIIFNAIKYSKNDSEITMSWQVKTLKVIDTGVGIAAADLPRIFESGFTGHNGRQYKKATGMGLYMARKVSGYLQQNISITSIEHEGTIAAIQFSTQHIR